MAQPSQLNVVVSTNSGGTVTTTTVTVPISAGLQGIDSGNNAGSGQGGGQVAQLNSSGIWAGGQIGFSSVDNAIRNILRAHGFTDGNGNWWPAGTIQKITWQ